MPRVLTRRGNSEIELVERDNADQYYGEEKFLEFWYCDSDSGREFDVRDLPARYQAELADDVRLGFRASHRKVIRRAMADGHEFGLRRAA
jgi:hypothetical protein